MLDHNAQLVSATRTCLDCGQTFTREQMHNRLGWEPIGAGWRCGDCSRAHNAELAERALALTSRSADQDQFPRAVAQMRGLRPR